jgi:two-component system phosphate regulon response regulator OmpR
MVATALFSEQSKPHILVIDDDDRIRDLLFRYLSDNGMIVSTARDTAEADKILKVALYDLLIVDVMMPNETGLEFSKRFRAKEDTPILLLTALGETKDRILGLETGADDYLPKPFDPKELLLRIQAILRRRPEAQQIVDEHRIGRWVYDPDLKELQDGSDKVRLTSVEASLLENLLRYDGKIFSRDELARLAGLEGNDRTIDVQVTRLRRKLGDDSKSPTILQTIRGQGYRLRTKPSAQDE